MTTATNPKFLEMENDRNRVHIAIDYKLLFLKSNLGSKWVVTDNNMYYFFLCTVVFLGQFP